MASAILNRVRGNAIRTPLGTVHFLEHLQNENPERRRRLAEVFELYSRGWYFASWSDVCEFEVRQALGKVFYGTVPLRPAVFKRGFMSTTGAKGREILLKESSKESIDFFSALSAQPGALFDLLTATIESNRKAQKATTATLSNDNAKANEDLRVRRRDCSREEYRLAQYATYTLQHEQLLIAELTRIRLSIADFVGLGKMKLRQFWSEIPSLDADCELTAYRDRQWSRQIQPNDVRDLAQLAIAVPYCDAIVVEKFWKRAISETGLGKKYRTAVFCDLAELMTYVESKSQSKWQAEQVL